MRMTLALRGMLDTILQQVISDDTKIHLIKTPFTPTEDAVIADFDEADYTGYAAQTILPAGTIAWDDAALNAVQSFASAHFQPTASTVTNTIYGYYVTGTVKAPTLDQLIDVFAFDVPVPLLGTADALDIVYEMKIGMPELV